MDAPNLKLESPSESVSDNFGSPAQQYSNLFEHEAMTPQSYDDDSMFGGSVAGGETPGPDAQKKPVKKRKSWGQQLPEPKTNLPPRKRAKTEDEKEQRRVERVLRNRRAAQSSRERKRQEVEALEAEKHQVELRNQDLEQQLAEMHAKCQMMQQQLEAATGGNMTIFGASATSPAAHTEQFRSAPSPVTLSQPLFGASEASPTHRDSFSSEYSGAPSQTINPASLSPPLLPVEFNASVSDLTQQPAVLLCDPQCQSETQRPWTSMAPLMELILMISTISWSILSPVKEVLEALRTGSSLSPTQPILAAIIFLTTTTANLTMSSSSSSTTKPQTNSRPMFSLRIRLLNHLLTCSPQCARPLLDATSGQMRLALERQASTDCLDGVGSSGRRNNGNGSPSMESLATLLWATQCFLNQQEENQKAPRPKLDLATVDVRQLSWELGLLFQEREIKLARSVSLRPCVGQNGMGRMSKALG